MARPLKMRQDLLGPVPQRRDPRQRGKAVGELVLGPEQCPKLFGAAVQFGVAYSSIVDGAGVIAGGPYHCARGSVNTATGEILMGWLASQTDMLADDWTVLETTNG